LPVGAGSNDPPLQAVYGILELIDACAIADRDDLNPE
jgi:hypothetical protein